MKNPKPEFNVFARGGCSQATGLSLRDILPAADFERDSAAHDFACAGFSFTIRMLPRPIGG
jgi:hypothetical protein